MSNKAGMVCSAALAALALLLSAPAQADGREHGHRGGHHWGHRGHGFHHHGGHFDRHVDRHGYYGPRWHGRPGYVVRERSYYYAPPPPVYYDPRPAVTISVPPIVVPF